MSDFERWLVEHVPPYSWRLPTWAEDAIELGILFAVLFAIVAAIMSVSARWRRRR
jgi:hypothetical protein